MLTDKEIDAAIEALEAALSDDQPYLDRCKAALAGLRSLKEQEPVAWVDTDKGVIVGTPRFFIDGSHGEVALYAHPAPVNQQLLEALKYFVSVVENSSHLDARRGIMGGAFDKARAAIKATEEKN